jgi:uncharacterized delta-60 repeat protein
VTAALGAAADDFAFALALQPDGKLVVAGQTTERIPEGDLQLARFNPNDSLDTDPITGFGPLDPVSGRRSGYVTTPFAVPMDLAYDLLLQADGKLVTGGVGVVTDSAVFGLTRYNADGSLDTTWNPAGPVPGLVTTPVGPGYPNVDVVNALALQADGCVVAAGTTGAGNTWDFALARYLGDAPAAAAATVDAVFVDAGVASLLIAAEEKAKRGS